jgi:hypothetical protein
MVVASAYWIEIWGFGDSFGGVGHSWLLKKELWFVMWWLVGACKDASPEGLLYIRI